MVVCTPSASTALSQLDNRFPTTTDHVLSSWQWDYAARLYDEFEIDAASRVPVRPPARTRTSFNTFVPVPAVQATTARPSRADRHGSYMLSLRLAGLVPASASG